MARKILIVTDDAGESYEILYATHRFREAGFRPVIASTRKKLLNTVIHDACPGWNTYVEKPGYLIASDLPFSRVKPADYAAILLIGGRAPEVLRHDAILIRIVREFYQRRKWIFAICHGIQIVLAAGLARGRKLTCYRHVRLEVESNGGRWIDKPSVRDGKIITAQTWESHAEFYRDIFANLEDG